MYGSVTKQKNANTGNIKTEFIATPDEKQGE